MLKNDFCAKTIICYTTHFVVLLFHVLLLDTIHSYRNMQEP
jgi:hypothetical protein